MIHIGQWQPAGVKADPWKLLAGGALLAGIGFTMSLFIAHLAFSDDLIDPAKLGYLVGVRGRR